MKKTLRILIPLILALAIVICTGWYLFVYDRDLTRNALLRAARYFDGNGNHSIATWFYNCAYKQSTSGDAVAIELAEQYKSIGNYTKAEYTLTNAIKDNGGVEVYIALCKTFVEQDKLTDAVKLLDNVTNTVVKEQLQMLRPAAPTCNPEPTSFGSSYTQYITVTISSEAEKLYVSNNGQIPSIEKDLYTGGIQLTDGENTIYAIAVADNGLVSPTAIFGFTVGGVIEKVNFTDAAMEQAIRQALKADADTVLYTNDLWTIKEFSVPENAQKLNDLRHLAFLEKLTVNNCVSGQLSHLSTLASLKELIVTDTTVLAEELPLIGKLPSLQKLTLSNCGLSTTTGLENAKELVSLDLSNNAIRNITPLSSLAALQQVNLSRNALNDLSALSGLSALTELDVSHNGLSTLSPITTIPGLKKLSASDNSLTEVNGFQQLTSLQTLNLSSNTLADIAVLASCVTLTDLNVADNALTDITALSALNALTDFDFSNNKVTKIPQWKTDCALININGSYNSISTLEPLKGLKKLNNVSMDYNSGITSVKALESCPRLIQVNIYGTGVKQVSGLTSQSIIVNYDPTK